MWVCEWIRANTSTVFDRLDMCVILQLLQRSREQTYYDNETVVDTTAIRDQDLVRLFRN